MPVFPLVASRMTLSRVSFAGAFAVPDHVQPGPILHRASRIEELGLTENLDGGEIAGDPLQANQWRVSNELQQISRDQKRFGARIGGDRL